jgi:hypothetical protein
LKGRHEKVTVKEALRQCDYLRKKKQNIDRRRAEVMAAVGGFGIDYSRMTGTRGGSVSDPTANRAIKLQELTEDKYALILQGIDLTGYAVDLICMLNDSQQIDVLTARYVRGHSFQQIARDMGSSEKTVANIHGRAMIALEELTQENTAAARLLHAIEDMAAAADPED